LGSTSQRVCEKKFWLTGSPGTARPMTACPRSLSAITGNPSGTARRLLLGLRDKSGRPARMLGMKAPSVKPGPRANIPWSHRVMCFTTGVNSAGPQHYDGGLRLHQPGSCRLDPDPFTSMTMALFGGAPTARPSETAGRIRARKIWTSSSSTSQGRR